MTTNGLNLKIGDKITLCDLLNELGLEVEKTDITHAIKKGCIDNYDEGKGDGGEGVGVDFKVISKEEPRHLGELDWVIEITDIFNI